MLRDVTKHGFEPIPTHVGYPDWPLVTLHGHEAFLEPAKGQGISYKGASGWANDWITNWTSEDAYAWWPVEVVEAGRYEIAAMYVCPPEHVGAKLRVEWGESAVEAVVRNAHDPAVVPSPDRVPRGEVYEKAWAELTLGSAPLNKGRGRLVLRATAIPGPQACDVKAIRLRRITSPSP
jgi:arylsulfatase A